MAERYERYYYDEQKERGSRFLRLAAGIALVGGGVLAYRSGLLKPAIQKAMVLGSNYKGTKVGSVINAIHRWDDAVSDKLPLRQQFDELVKYIQSASRGKVPQKVPPIYLEDILENAARILQDLQSQWYAAIETGQLIGAPEDVVNALDIVQKKMLEAINGKLEVTQELKDEMLKRLGARHLTLEDVMNLNTKETLRLRLLASQFGADELKNVIVDPAMFITEQGRIIDLRFIAHESGEFLKRLEREYVLPFVNFNPLGLLHFNAVVGLERSPLIHVFEEHEIQPLLTGTTKALGRKLLFVGGEVYDLNALGLILPRTVEDLVRVNPGQKGYLIHGTSFISREYIRSMAGIPTRTYTRKAGGLRDKFGGLFDLGDIGKQDIYRWEDKLLGGKEWDRSIGGITDAINEAMENAVKMTSPWREDMPPQEAIQFVHQKWIYVNRADFSSLGSVARQFFAGRRNLKDVSTLTLLPYIGAARMNVAAAAAGLGISIEHKGSASDVLLNLFLRRALLFAGAAFAWHYLNYEMEKLTGVRPEDVLADAYVETTIGLSAIGERLGLPERMKRLKALMPGLDQILELPVIDKATIWMDKTAEEMREYWERGEEFIRKGRWWPLNNEPFTGGRILVYVPNWYRRLKSRWQYTDVLYGSEDEYFAHAPIPTPRYPLAPIRRYFLDPYWLEKKHYRDRPYLVTGDIPEIVELPIIGPLLTPISRLLKPQRRMHPEAWEQLEGERARRAKYLTPEETPPASEVKIDDVRIIPVTVRSGREQALAVILPVRGNIAPKEGEAEGERDKAVVLLRPQQARGRQVEVSPAIVIPGRKEEEEIVVRRDENGRLVDQYGREYVVSGDLKDVLKRTWAGITEMAGFYGFFAENALGIEGKPPQQKIADSRAIDSYRRRFWNLELGGLGGDINELVRRFIGKRERWGQMYNPIRNTMPSWLPGEDYFIDFHHGDPYTKVEPYGEILMPGGGYEALYDVPVAELFKKYPELKKLEEAGLINRFELYDPFNRFRVLAHVAPYSREYKYYSKLMSEMKLTPEQREEVKRLREQVRRIKEPLRIYPYRFKYKDVARETVTVEKVIDQNTILVEEYPDHPIRFAGIYVTQAKDEKESQEALEWLQSTLKPGTKITIWYDPEKKFADDTYSTIRAVVWVRGMNVNRELLERGWAKEKEKDWSAPAVYARFSPMEILFGRLWETFAHLDTPFHTKFLQVRSAYESWTRREVYGKSFQRWENPISDYLIPTYESFISKPLPVAILFGAALGALFGRRRASKIIGALAGSAIVGAGSLYRTLYEFTTGEKWIPARRRKEWELEEYIDILKYVKYRRLFEHERMLAAKEEGFDVIEYIESLRHEKETRKARIKDLLEAKRLLYKQGREADLHEIIRKYDIKLIEEKEKEEDLYDRVVRSINRELEELRRGRKIDLEQLPEHARKALVYYKLMKQTMYGYEPGEPLSDFLVALPKKERRYMRYFLTMPEEEYEKLKKVAPRWLLYGLAPVRGDRPPEKPSLEEYFRTHTLPDPSWEGWRPDVDLDKVKVKLIRKMGLDPGEFDVWPEDITQAEAENVRVPRMRSRMRPQEVAEMLRRYLSGIGVEDVDIAVEPSDRDEIQLDMDIGYDFSSDLVSLINSDPALLIRD